MELAIKYEKGLLKVDQIVGEELSQHLIEGDLIIPEGKPEIAGILDISATIFGTGKEVVQDKVMVEGIIRYNLLYREIGDDRSIAQIEDDILFTEYLDIEGAGPRMTADVTFELEHIDYDTMDNRTLNVKAVLNMDCKVRELRQLEILRDFREEDRVQVLRESIKLISTEGYGSGQTIIREDVEIPENMPSIVGILKKNAKVKVLEKTVTDNRVIAHGEIDLELLYQANETTDPIQVLEYNFPFSHFVEVQGAYQGMDSKVRVEVQEMDIALRQDVIGDVRVLSIDMMLFMEGRVFEGYEQEIITDAYSPGSVLKLSKEKIVINRPIGEGQSQSIIRDNIEVGESMPPISEILYTEIRPLISDYRIEEGLVSIDGILSGTVLYRQGDETLPISSLKIDIPFTQDLEIEGASEDMDCNCEAIVQYTSHTLISPREFEIKVTMLNKAAVSESYEKEILLDLEEAEGSEENISGIYVYFVQPGDSLWTVAKRYNTTAGNILQYNEIEDQDSLEAGSKIIIFKKLDTSIA